MCGISGVVVRNDAEEVNKIYWHLLRQSDIRGQDGTGYTVIESSGVSHSYRSNIRARDIREFVDLKVGDVCIGQNRLAIFGDDMVNNQPIKIGGFYLVHNGNLVKGYENIFKQQGWARTLQVDSELIVKMLNEKFCDYLLNTNISADQDDVMKRAIEFTKKTLKGNFACLLVSPVFTKKIFAFSKYKPLYYIEYNDNIYFFSTLRIAKGVFPISEEELSLRAVQVNNADTLVMCV